MLIFYIAYFTVLESSQKQATFGKRALRLKVVDAEGQRLSPGKALVRSCSKILSGLVAGVGFFMISFDDKKQGLHDHIAKTYVVRVQGEEPERPEEKISKEKVDPYKTLFVDPAELSENLE